MGVLRHSYFFADLQTILQEYGLACKNFFNLYNKVGRNGELCTFPRCSFAFKAFSGLDITGQGYYPGLAVPVRFLAALCALNTGSGSPVSGSVISALFHSFCMWRSVLFFCAVSS